MDDGRPAAFNVQAQIRRLTFKRSNVQTFKHFLRVFLAVITFLTLTMTVMQREDRDGYQATHLYFMPRSTWEKDEGRGMLHDEEYYHDIDLEELAEEWLYEYEGEHEEEGEGSHLSGPTVRRAPHAPDLRDNQIPLESKPIPWPRQPWLAVPAWAGSLRPTSWVGEVPTPPPKRR